MIRKLKRQGPDNRTIHIDDEHAIDFWAREFKVTPEKIRQAVLFAGESASAVKKVVRRKYIVEKKGDGSIGG